MSEESKKLTERVMQNPGLRDLLDLFILLDRYWPPRFNV